MRGHEEASGTKYYPEGLIDSWKAKDPYRPVSSAHPSEAGLDDGGRRGLPWKRAAIKKCLKALNAALEEPNPAFDVEEERARMSMRREPERDTACSNRQEPVQTLRMIDAIARGLMAEPWSGTHPWC